MTDTIDTTSTSELALQASTEPDPSSPPVADPTQPDQGTPDDGDTDESPEPGSGESDEPQSLLTEAAISADAVKFRELPWNGVVTGNVDNDGGTETAQDLLIRAGLDWDVAARPLWRRLGNGTFEQHPIMRETYRTDTEQTLGSVRGKYQLFSNRDAFAFLDSIVADGRAHLVEAGQQTNGTRVFMTMKLDEGFDVLDDDHFDLYLFLRTSHDGSTGISVDVVPFRAWCLNQTQLALSTALHRWTVSHTVSAKERMQEAQDTLRLTGEYTLGLRQALTSLGSINVTIDNARAIVDAAVPERRARRDEMINDIITTYETSQTVEPYRGTAYGVLNGVTEYYDHLKTQRTGHARLQSIMYGEGSKVRNNVVSSLLALAS